MERTECIICNNNIEFLYELKKMPISLSPTNQDKSTDKFEDQCIYYCKKCSSVQLKNLIDPSILYESAHNLTFHLPLWNEHHYEFSKFIMDNYKYDSLMEIGGSSGALYDKLKEFNIKYSCIDMCKANFDTKNIEYIVGNCENYNFNNVKSIALSHVFEHLYNPNKFIENIDNNNITSVYISIPNMTKLLENESSSVLHYEHTYFVDKYLTEYMFSIKGYKLVKYNEFKSHSIFMLFEKTNCPVINLESRDYIIEKVLSIYMNMTKRFSKYIIKNNSFIIPSGHMGQLVYTMAKPGSILGFLDNDPMKQNKRLYGTPYKAYPISKLNEFKDNINIYIYAGPYLNEILKQLEQYKNVTIYII
jgi:hypothetical protein